MEFYFSKHFPETFLSKNTKYSKWLLPPQYIGDPASL